jgi:polyhydroxyalkanoate synthesis repressor PhaR
MQTPPSEDTITIKRYSNRRLYDTHNSEYVNIEKIAEMVRDGQRLQVIDTSTGDDVTHVILTQIILNEQKDQKEGLPLELLFQLVRRSGSSYVDAMKELMSIGPKAYEKTVEEIKSTLSPQTRQETPTSTDDQISELKKRLAEVEAKLDQKKD